MSIVRDNICRRADASACGVVVVSRTAAHATVAASAACDRIAHLTREAEAAQRAAGGFADVAETAVGHAEWSLAAAASHAAAVAAVGAERAALALATALEDAAAKARVAAREAKVVRLAAEQAERDTRFAVGGASGGVVVVG